MSKHYREIKAAFANIWALGRDVNEATITATDYSAQRNWRFISLEQDAIETTLEDCPSPEARNGFLKAQEFGCYGIFVAAGISAAGGDASSN